MTPWFRDWIASARWAKMLDLKNIPQALELNDFNSWSDIPGIFTEILLKLFLEKKQLFLQKKQVRLGTGENRKVRRWRRGWPFMPEGNEICNNSK